MMWLRVVIFELILFRVYELLAFVNSCLFLIGKLIISSGSFSANPFLLFFQNSGELNTRSLNILIQASECLFF